MRSPRASISQNDNGEVRSWDTASRLIESCLGDVATIGIDKEHPGWLRFYDSGVTGLALPIALLAQPFGGDDLDALGHHLAAMQGLGVGRAVGGDIGKEHRRALLRPHLQP